MLLSGTQSTVARVRLQPAFALIALVALPVLVCQYSEEAFCAPKVRLKWYGIKGIPWHSSHCFGGLIPQYSGGSPATSTFLGFGGSRRSALSQPFFEEALCSHLGFFLLFPNTVALNAVGRRNMQMSTKETQVCKSESGRGGWKTQVGGKHTVSSAKNPFPKMILDPPPTIRFPPPFLATLCHFP